MFKQFFTKGTAFQSHLLSAAVVAACLILFIFAVIRPSRPSAGGSPAAEVKTPSGTTKDVGPKLHGAAALEYLEKTNDGRSLAQAVTAARFGLKHYQHSPFGGSDGGGYLGMSHVQNLNAWFDDEGATIRPTLSEEERAKA